MNPNRVTLLLATAMMFGSLLAVPSASAAHAEAALTSARQFKVVNATFDSITALAIAPADDGNFNDVAIGQPLQGGLSSLSFDVPTGGCLRDLRVTFQGGRRQLFQHIDVCRTSGLRLTSRGGG